MQSSDFLRQMVTFTCVIYIKMQKNIMKNVG